MTTRRRTPALLTGLLLAGAVLQGVPAAGERHALLIGIGDYPELHKLAGPEYDVEALSAELVRNWAFRPENVRRLGDSRATKRSILNALDRLTVDTEPGDDVFIYYSGHGTSAFDEELNRHGEDLLGDWTGAIMPYDYATGLPENPTPESWVEALIIGNRDLKPRLARLDRDRDVFVVFDTCFSGYTVRSISQRPVRWVSPPRFRSTRSIRFADDPFEGPVFGTATASRPEYPYRRLIYLAAAGKKERAEEMPARYTVDRRPHGALTNSLLKALAGAADADRDTRLTYFEVFEYVRDDVNEHHQQMPQLFYPEDDPGALARPIFDQRRKRPSPAVLPGDIPGNTVTEFPTGVLRVRLDPGIAHLGRRIEALSRVELAGPGPYHVRLESERDGQVALYHQSGDRIAGGFDVLAPRQLLERLERQVEVQALIDLAYPRQDFTLALNLPRGRGFLYRDERFEITAGAEEPVIFVLVNVDKTGSVTVLYPMKSSELTPKKRLAERFEVIAPYGTEYLKLFAFDRPPERLAYWINQKVDVLDPRFGELVEFFENPGTRRAETRLKVVTVGELIYDDRPGGRTSGR